MACSHFLLTNTDFGKTLKDKTYTNIHFNAVGKRLYCKADMIMLCQMLWHKGYQTTKMFKKSPATLVAGLKPKDLRFKTLVLNEQKQHLG